MKKKFTVRITHFLGTFYKIEYANYYIFPIYRTLKYWFECNNLTSNLECWSTLLLPLEEAETLAKTLHTFEDIAKWYERHIKKEALFYKRKKEFLEKNVPYKTKIIK